MESKNEKLLAAIRIRGLIGINSKIRYTLKILRLYKSNFCVVLPNTINYIGMLKKAKDYITWGEIDDDTFKLLIDKRAELFNGREKDTKEKIKYNDYFVVNNKKLKRYFRLNAPRKGFGRKGIKHSFKEGGALGYRGTAINDLINRML